MILAVLAGWSLAAAMAARAAGLERRLDRAGDAEHELRGALTAFGLGLERGPRAALESELARAHAGLADLAAARAGQGAPRPAAEVVDLRRLSRAAASAWGRAGGRRVELEWRAGPVRVRADRGRVAQALGNLVSNAVEHGAGPVRLIARRRGRAIRIEVVNGTPSNPPRPGAPGRGRGLAIAARAAELCGGRLDAEPAEGRAAIELPLAR